MFGLGILIFKKEQIEVHFVSPWELALVRGSGGESEAEKQHLMAALRKSGKDWKPNKIISPEQLQNFIDNPEKRGDLACDNYMIVDFPPTSCWMVVRNGITSTQTESQQPVAIVLHKDEEQVAKIAEKNISKTVGQFFTYIRAEESPFKEWMELAKKEEKSPGSFVFR